MDHGLDVLVAELGGFLDAPFKGFVVVPNEFEVYADVDICHI